MTLTPQNGGLTHRRRFFEKSIIFINYIIIVYCILQ